MLHGRRRVGDAPGAHAARGAAQRRGTCARVAAGHAATAADAAATVPPGAQGAPASAARSPRAVRRRRPPRRPRPRERVERTRHRDQRIQNLGRFGGRAGPLDRQQSRGGGHVHVQVVHGACVPAGHAGSAVGRWERAGGGAELPPLDAREQSCAGCGDARRAFA